MENRKIVDEVIQIRIGVDKVETYKKDFTWRELINTKGILPTDIIYNFYYNEEKESGMFSLAMEDELRTFWVPTIQVVRRRLETDEEFLTRKTEEQQRINISEEKERLEYLRLKAKFETK